MLLDSELAPFLHSKGPRENACASTLRETKKSKRDSKRRHQLKVSRLFVVKTVPDIEICSAMHLDVVIAPLVIHVMNGNRAWLLESILRSIVTKLTFSRASETEKSRITANLAYIRPTLL